MSPVSFQLRKARPEDQDFLWLLKQRTMRNYVEQTWGRWNDSKQKAWFTRNFSPSASQIITINGNDAGRLEVNYHPDGITLGTIETMPEFQGHGIGSAVIVGLQAKAKSASLPLNLHVLKANPRAHQLYVSLGFKSTGESATHHLMVWQTGVCL